MIRVGLVVAALLLPATAVAAPKPCPEIPEIDSRCEAWVATYDNPNGYGQYGWDGGRAIAADPAGNRVFVTGFSHDDTSGAWDIVTAAFNVATGQQLWASRHNGALSEFDDAMGITAAGGRVFVTGVVDAEFNQNDGDIVTLAYDAATGSPLWSRTFGTPTGRERPSAIAADTSGERVYVTGTADPEGQDTHSDLVLLAYDGRTGDEAWDASFDGVGEGDDVGQSVAVSADGDRVFVAGTSLGLGDAGDYDYDIVILAFEAGDPDRLGSVVWSSSYDRGFRLSETASDVALSPDGSRVYVAGTAQRGGASLNWYYNEEIATFAYDAESGEMSWMKTFYGPSFGLSLANDMVVTATDRVVVTGNVTGDLGDTDWDIGIVAYKGDGGEELWARRTGTRGSDYESGTGVAASPNGATIFVTGFSRIQSGEHVVTFAYETESGTPSWSARYNGSVAGTNYDSGEAIVAVGNRAIATASLRDDLAFLINPGSTNFNYGDIGVLAYAA